MPKPTCVKCQRFFRMKRSGVYVVEGMPNHGLAKPGTAEPHLWSPYKLWAADLWRCDGCGAEILAGYGLQPMSHHHNPDFGELVEGIRQRDKLMPQINDC